MAELVGLSYKGRVVNNAAAQALEVVDGGGWCCCSKATGSLLVGNDTWEVHELACYQHIGLHTKGRAKWGVKCVPGCAIGIHWACEGSTR